jgi:TonB-dependent starch-binding outer membrane protein SusC
LDLALKGTGLSFSINGRNINIIKSAALSQNSRKITGTVIDSNNIPIIGASVLIKGTANGVITDVDGNFILNDVASDAVIVVSYVGYQTLEQVVKGKYLQVHI